MMCFSLIAAGESLVYRQPSLLCNFFFKENITAPKPEPFMGEHDVTCYGLLYCYGLWLEHENLCLCAHPLQRTAPQSHECPYILLNAPLYNLNKI